MNPAEKSKKLVDLIHQFENAMLITHDRDRLDARSLAIAKAATSLSIFLPMRPSLMIV